MRRRRGRCVSMVVEGGSECLLKLSIEGRSRRRCSRPMAMLHNLGRANSANSFMCISVDVRRIRSWCWWCRWLPRSSRRTNRSENRAFSECLWLFGSSVMRSFGIRFERFSKRFGLLRRGLRTWCTSRRQGTRRSAHGSKVVWKDLDKVGWEQTDCSSIAPQPARPPRAISGVETFDQIAFYETKIAFVLFV